MDNATVWRPDPKEIERLAKGLCRALGYDPTTRVSRSSPTLMLDRLHLYIVPTEHLQFELWQDFAPETEELLRLLHEQPQTEEPSAAEATELTINDFVEWQAVKADDATREKLWRERSGLI